MVRLLNKAPSKMDESLKGGKNGWTRAVLNRHWCVHLGNVLVMSFGSSWPGCEELGVSTESKIIQYIHFIMVDVDIVSSCGKKKKLKAQQTVSVPLDVTVRTSFLSCYSSVWM